MELIDKQNEIYTSTRSFYVFLFGWIWYRRSDSETYKVLGAYERGHYRSRQHFRARAIAKGIQEGGIKGNLRVRVLCRRRHDRTDKV